MKQFDYPIKPDRWLTKDPDLLSLIVDGLVTAFVDDSGDIRYIAEERLPEEFQRKVEREL